MKLILDAMSGDLGSAPAVEAAVRAVQELGLEVTLVGREAEIREKLTGRTAGITVVNASEVVDMHDAPTTVIRQKKDSSMVLASQNIEDFLIPNIREMTKPLFSIPTHQFLFNPGQINPRDYMDALQVEQAEYDLIHSCERGHNLYRCGNERYLLQVIAPEHKVNLFGNAGGR